MSICYVAQFEVTENFYRLLKTLPPPRVFTPSVTNYMLLNSTLLCKKIAGAPGGVKNVRPLSWGGGAEQIRELSCSSRCYARLLMLLLLSQSLVSLLFKSYNL